MEDSSLNKLEKRYAEECEDEPPNPPPPICPAPETKQSIPTWVKALGAVAGATAVVVCIGVEPCGLILMGGAAAAAAAAQ